MDLRDGSIRDYREKGRKDKTEREKLQLKTCYYENKDISTSA